MTLEQLYELAEHLGIGRKLVYNPQDGMTLLRKGRNKLYEDIHTGRLRAIPNGRRFQIPAGALLEYLNQTQETK